MRWARGSMPTLAGLVLASAACAARAEVVTDGTAGPAVRLDGPDFAIPAELGTRAGPNLFHSFQRFDLSTLADGTIESATFSGPAEIRHIVGRVTGGERSDINGVIRSEIPGAHLYFINPSGVVFGPNASLEVQGSFHVSSADELRFTDGTTFSAREPSAVSSFTIARPEAFGFLGRDAGPIRVDGAELPVAPDESVSLVGGDIRLDHGLIVPGDVERNTRVALVAMSRPGTVGLSDGRTSTEPGGEIRISGDGGVEVPSFAGGGIVRVRAGALVMEGGFILADNLEGDLGTATALIDIEAGHVHLTNGAEVASIAFGPGNAGDVTVRTRELDLLSGASLRSDTESAGAAGAVSVLGARRVLISREGSDERTDISSSVALLSEEAVPGQATGSAGPVTVEADHLTVRDSGAIFSNSLDAGDAGRIEVRAGRIELLSGGQIGSGTLGESTGTGGNVIVTAREQLLIDGESRQRNDRTGRFEPSGIFASTESVAADAGNAGTAIVRAPVIRLSDRGEIASETVNRGRGGALRVVAEERLVIDDAEITTKAEGSGPAGAITVQANAIELRNGGLISSESTGTGAAGPVAIEDSALLLLDAGTISTEAARAGGGQITIQVRDLIALSHDSVVSTTVSGDASTTAGDITIDPRFILLNGGSIIAQADEGRGGNIRITVDNLIQSPDGVISASAGPAGIDGTIVISTPEVDVTGGLLVLEVSLLDAASLLRERCDVRRDAAAGSFTGVARSLPPGPEQPLASNYSFAGTLTGGPNVPQWTSTCSPPLE